MTTLACWLNRHFDRTRAAEAARCIAKALSGISTIYHFHGPKLSSSQRRAGLFLESPSWRLLVRVCMLDSFPCFVTCSPAKSCDLVSGELSIHIWPNSFPTTFAIRCCITFSCSIKKAVREPFSRTIGLSTVGSAEVYLAGHYNVRVCDLLLKHGNFSLRRHEIPKN